MQIYKYVYTQGSGALKVKEGKPTTTLFLFFVPEQFISVPIQGFRQGNGFRRQLGKACCVDAIREKIYIDARDKRERHTAQRVRERERDEVNETAVALLFLPVFAVTSMPRPLTA